jgi:hypothetical protein
MNRLLIITRAHRTGPVAGVPMRLRRRLATSAS